MKTQAGDSINSVLGKQDKERLLNAFFVAYKTARIIDENNPTFQRQCRSFFDQMKAVASETTRVTIKTVSGRYFVNEKVIRFDDTGLSGAASVVSEWQALGVGGVTFLSEVTMEQTAKFFIFMATIKPDSHNLESLSARLKTEQLSDIYLLSLEEVESDKKSLSDEERQQFREVARAGFFRAMSTVQEVMVSASQGLEINTARTKRVVHSLIDQIARDEDSLIELTAIKTYDDYTYAHSTNVCIYALTLGVRLDLDRGRLSRLGFTALFHDIGKVRLPVDLIHKPEAYDEDDWIQMQQHPLMGAKTILRNLKFDAHVARAARGAFEHHINQDFTGYPSLKHRKRSLNLFSRIISVVDTFDALTSGRVYLRKSLAPDEVLRKMHFQMNTKFDALLLKIFNDVVGVYPPGSLVLLTSDELALVLTNNETNRTRPYVKIVGDRKGLHDTPEWVDLSLPDQSHRSIMHMIDPERYGLDLKDFILHD
ncbi:MAG: HD domain-containing protein [candidate division Zixibacteria bacterium]|nr:HD domain-containing protein [candidate division Zixibacteria bacterium]